MALEVSEIKVQNKIIVGTQELTSAVTSVGGTGTVAGLTLSGTVTTTGNLTLGGTLSTPVSTINDSTTVGQNLVKLANPSAIRFIRINANNTVDALTDANFRTAIGAGTGSGTVTGVTGTAPIASSGGTAPVISITAATQSAAGSMSSADKTKLDGIATGATANTGTVTSVGITAGTGISVSGSPITGSGSITVTNSSPDQTVALTGAGTVSVSGTYPNFTITGSGGGGGGDFLPLTGGTLTGNLNINYSLIGRGTRTTDRGELFLNATGTNDVSEIFFGFGNGFTENNIRWGISDRGTTSGLLNFYRGPANGGFTGVMTLDGINNRVGIGTESPGHKLDVNGSSRFRDTMFFGASDSEGLISWNANGFVMHGQSGKGMAFGANGVNNHMYINTSGNVGIGTMSPTHRLHISDSAPRVTLQGTNAGSNVGYRFVALDSGSTSRTGGYYFQPITGTNQSYLGFTATDNAYQMIVRADGNVGIGTDSPGAKLDVNGEFHVRGNIKLTGTPTTTNQARIIEFTGFDKEGTGDFSDNAYIRHTVNSGGLAGSVLEISSQNDADDGINFLTNGANTFRHNGNVIITEANIGSQSVNFANNAETSNRNIVFDVRDTNKTPAQYNSHRSIFEFNNLNLASSTWWGVMTVKGWDGNYAAWQLAGPASVGENKNDLFFRGGQESTWGSWRRMFHDGVRDITLSTGTGGNFGNRLIVGNTDTSFTLQDSNLRPTIQAHGAYPVLSLNHTVTSNTSHGPTIQFTSNGTGNQFVIGTTGNGSRLDIGTSSNSSWNPHNGIADYLGITALSINTGGNVGINTISPSTSHKLDVNGETILRSWLTFNNNAFFGLYSPNNGAHFYPNNATYGAWRVAGSRNGWGGIEFDSSAGGITMMVSSDGNTVGWHHNNYGWQTMWQSGTFYVNKNTYGGGTQAVVLDSSNRGSYAAAVNSTDTASGGLKVRLSGTTLFITNNGNNA